MSYDFEPLSWRIIGAAIEVHRSLGPGYIESIYHGAMKVALDRAGIAYESQAEVRIVYEGIDVGTHYLDLLVVRQIVVELKAVRSLQEIHYAQVRSYLKATGLLLNFNAPVLDSKRVVWTPS